MYVEFEHNNKKYKTDSVEMTEEQIISAKKMIETVMTASNNCFLQFFMNGDCVYISSKIIQNSIVRIIE